MKVTKLQIDKIFITHGEIESICEVELPEHLDRIRDTFLFAVILDFNTLTYSDYQNVIL